MKTAGVIGGLGPAATLDFFAKMIAAANARRDQDHVRLIIDSNPSVPNRNDAIAGRGPSAGPALAAMAQGLERAGADFLAMICNTAHFYQSEIEAAVSIPFLSMIDASADDAAAVGARRAGLLAAEGCLAAGLYQNALAARGIAPVLLEAAAQARFMDLIYRIKGGEVGAAARAEMRALTEEFAGADAIIAGCTEAPLALSQSDLAVPLIASTDSLVARVLAAARAA